MQPTAFARVTLPQFEAALSMLRACVKSCPAAAWSEPVATHAFWHVCYHVLCFTDLYLAPSMNEWVPDKGTRAQPGLHPRGLRGLWDEVPAREFTPAEIDAYAVLCRAKAAAALGAETVSSLKGPSGFSWIPGPRPETYFYNLRHLSHHVGQLTGRLRVLGISTPWEKSGWTEPRKGRRVGTKR